MRITLFLFLLFSIGCFGQQTKEQSSKAGKLKLVEPKPGPPSPEDTLMFKNSIVLFRQHYTVIYDNTENTFTGLKALSSYLLKASPLLRQRKLYVLIGNNTKPEKIVSVLDLLQKHKVGNYKVVNAQEYFTPPTSNEYQAPAETISAPNAYDSSYFSIEISKDSFKLTLPGKDQTFNTSAEVDSFISANKMHIDPNKIVLFAAPHVPYEKFKPILDVLRKHEYYKFKLVSQ
jgi:biopolymer transport protein ExbD